MGSPGERYRSSVLRCAARTRQPCGSITPMSERIEVQDEAEPEWEYQCRLSQYSDGTPGPWVSVGAGHRCSGERRRRLIGPWEPVPDEGGKDRG